jgi:hypothetical protein
LTGEQRHKEMAGTSPANVTTLFTPRNSEDAGHGAIAGLRVIPGGARSASTRNPAASYQVISRLPSE